MEGEVVLYSPTSDVPGLVEGSSDEDSPALHVEDNPWLSDISILESDSDSETGTALWSEVLYFLLFFLSLFLSCSIHFSLSIPLP